MTPEEINRAISISIGDDKLVGLRKRGYWYRANACGYTDRESEAGRFTLEEAKKHEYLKGDEPVTIVQFKPRNFYGDLNAILPVVAASFNTGQREEFANHMCILVLGEPLERTQYLSATAVGFILTHAKAPDYSEAYLRTINKWVEEKKGEG